MNQSGRFQDENLILSNFFDEVLVVCPACTKKAIAKTNSEAKSFSYNKNAGKSVF